MAKSLKLRTEHSVLGHDTDVETMAIAHMSGAIDGVLDPDDIGKCDVVMIALPPAALLRWAEVNCHLIKNAVLIDLCGVKRGICKKLKEIAFEHGFRYIGGHPMAGREVSGFKNASTELFCGASMILTPDENTDIATLETLKKLFLEIGFDRITLTSPEEHDRIIAYTSQLAHITSNAYIKSPTAQMNKGFSAGSFKDMTRVAKLDEKLWTELFLGNADFLTEELRLLVNHLTEYLSAIEMKDAARLTALLKEGRELKAAAEGN